ncbi:hypothetical protein HZS55_01465 [Halosimplex rubrum]|uniref:Uncharacterized protein n=1 Tax=Halosimplex rubrum TaxID=869889 RepID=A0A7D5P7N0_9EURY|nr:hypothetical protein HZS55_01465 [Halosimplex rubrum]
MFATLSPLTVAVAVVGLVGIVPVAIQYRERSRWFAVGYGLLVVAALATNLEDLFLGDLLNATEHAVGLMGAGIAFLVAAYVHRKREIEPEVPDGG